MQVDIEIDSRLAALSATLFSLGLSKSEDLLNSLIDSLVYLAS